MTNTNSNDELEDGVVVRVPLLMMDSRTVLDDGVLTGLHRPGFRYTATDAVAVTKVQMARDEYQDRLTNAWRNAAPTVEDVETVDAPTVEDAYLEYDRRTAYAWRSK